MLSKSLRVCCLALTVLGCSFGLALAQSAPPPDSNLLAFGAGAMIERSTSEYGDGWNALWLIDESPSKGWASAEAPSFPQDIVISLPERSEFHRFEFDTAAVEDPGYGAGDVDIFVSDEGADTGFKLAGQISLKPAQDRQSIVLAAPATGRWVKLSIKSNSGNPKYVELMDVRGYGVALTSTPLANVSGTYSSPGFGKFHLAQVGAHLTGCYEYHKGLIEGGLEAHLLRLTWFEEGPKSGPALMVAKSDGKGFIGLWQDAGTTDDWHNDWNLKKLSSDVGSCPQWKPKSAKTNIIATSLSQQGRIRLYGINFDTDSDKIRADAKPAIDQLVAALKANMAWKLTIEGHTDASGVATKNQDLSARRAASVKQALVEAGIADDRLTTIGYGQDKPVASNDTQEGRAQNRRVEAVKD